MYNGILATKKAKVVREYHKRGIAREERTESCVVHTSLSSHIRFRNEGITGSETDVYFKRVNRKT